MPIDLEHYARSLVSLKEARVVAEKAREYLEHWPDPYTQARKLAAAYLLRHTGQALDPDRVWWNVFDTGVGAPTFTGWRHSGPPRESIRFTDLLIQRFDAGFQRAPDVLPVYGGFYRQGEGASRYGVHNEIKLDPQRVMSDLWSLDFAASLHQANAAFWQAQGSDFALLARVRLLAAVEEGMQQGTLQAFDRQRLRTYLGVPAVGPMGLPDLYTALDPDTYTVHHALLEGGGHLLTLTARDDRVLLYCPNTEWPPQAFPDWAALLSWVHGQLAADYAQEWLDTLCGVQTHGDAADRRQVLAGYRQCSGTAQSPQWPFGPKGVVEGDVFSELQHWAQADLLDCQRSMVSNQALRKALWRGYLGAFLQVAAPLVPMAWPLGLLVLGAGTAKLVLDGQALATAHSTRQRQSAVLAVVGDAVAVVFSLIDLSMVTRALTFRAPPHERLPLTDDWRVVRGRGDEIDDLDGNRILDPVVQAAGLLRNVSVDEEGATWIELQDLTLPVRYSPDSDSWLAVSEDDPFALLPSYPVRVVDDGSWQLFEPPAPEGVLSEGVDVLTSRFWDTYMSDDLSHLWEMSQTLLETQCATLAEGNLPQFDAAASPEVDDLGYDCIVVDGQRHYIWREGEAYVSQLVRIYTSEMSQVNNVFRHGLTGSIAEGDGDVIGYLNRLFDSLETLPASRAVRLWRGGSNYRLTGGVHFRNGDLNPGDVLVSTDITSFTENPYVLRTFVAPEMTTGVDRQAAVFNETSVVYELVGQGMRSGKPVGPMSLHPMENEVIYPPGCCFRIESVRQVRGARYHFIKVRLREVEKPAHEPIYDLRTGQRFDHQAYLARVEQPALVERLFPSARWPSS